MSFLSVSRTVGSAPEVGRLVGELSTGALTILYALERWRLPSEAPRDELHGLHALLRFEMSSLPPSETATMWSTVVAMPVQQSRRMAQSGLSSSTSLRLAR